LKANLPFKSTRLYHMVTTLVIITNHADAILGQTNLTVLCNKGCFTVS